MISLIDFHPIMISSQLHSKITLHLESKVGAVGV